MSFLDRKTTSPSPSPPPSMLSLGHHFLDWLYPQAAVWTKYYGLVV